MNPEKLLQLIVLLTWPDINQHQAQALESTFELPEIKSLYFKVILRYKLCKKLFLLLLI